MKALINCEIAEKFTMVTGIEAVPLPAYKRLDLPVCAHADMLFCLLDNTIFCYRDYVEENGLLSIITECGLDVIFVEKSCEIKYPNNVSLNVLVMGKTLLANVKYVAKEILDYAKNHGYSVVNVKQGYAACTVLAIDESNCITSDPGMAKALLKSGKNVLLADNSSIGLKGYDVGFFGGATAVVGERVYFFGDYKKLNEYEKINAFIKSCGKEAVSLSCGGVFDFGGVKLI